MIFPGRAAVGAVGMALTILAVVLPTASGFDHPTRADIEKAKADGTFNDRLLHFRQLELHRTGAALRDRALFRIRRAALQAQGLSAAEISARLFGGQQMAFPFNPDTDLRPSGTQKTLTILIDFNDIKADVVLPGMTAGTIGQNIYGAGTPAAAAFLPFDSVHNYYARASEGKLNIQGNVLGWYHLPKNRGDYFAPPAGGDNSALRNQAIFDMVKEAMGAFDAAHDFSQYDNDHDGDIDLVTILYTGPDTGWGSFWWAYRWSFFVPEASTRKFDGKTLKQFVFQFVNPRGPAGDDFNPQTLTHEMGHSFGLPDYYDYDTGSGPPGGLGGLDMMDANVGNHNAFSRWLLDWITPQVVGSGPPVLRTLLASGSGQTGVKAIAIFPGASNPLTPDPEMYIIENRFRIGNDGGISGAPGDGLLIWHVDARPNTTNNNFLEDNSYTGNKLIRVVRADNSSDFLDGENAGPGTYFLPPGVLTPTSLPNSNGYNGPTGISVTAISAPAETMTALIGFVPTPGGPAPGAGGAAVAVVAPAVPGAEAAARAQPPAAGADGRPTTIAADLRRVLERAKSKDGDVVDIDRLEAFSASLRTATPEAIAAAWNETLPQIQEATGSREGVVTLKLLLSAWAAKDGPKAVEAVLALPDGPLKRSVFPKVMECWAANDPYSAALWYFDRNRDTLRKSKTLKAGEAFASRVFGWASRNDPDKAVEAIKKLDHPSEVMGAIQALEDVAKAAGMSPQSISDKLKAASETSETIRAVRKAIKARDALRDAIKDPKLRSELKEFFRERMREEDEN
ncbi:M6 family metalloprotease domain-containing protein [Aquisphaera insulae]|uniref:M6 family metalloprotease domain-containing protein n=1 Tax=Aquisphaera insulae TaxID=2712864 RepID=UPI0013E9D400|nr:M6 family metalloprotease domain-containing protein [Aquisphaera insulae]